MANAFSNETEKAKQLCVQVMKKASKEIKRDNSWICRSDTRSLAYWQCVDDKIEDGEGVGYASFKCEEYAWSS